MSGPSTDSEGDGDVALTRREEKAYISFSAISSPAPWAGRSSTPVGHEPGQGARKGRRFLASKYPAYPVNLRIPAYSACVVESSARKG